MSKVMIIGAGGVGGVVTHKCAQLPEVFSEIVLASRTLSKCDAIAAQLDRPIRTVKVDADNVPELAALLKQERPELVINVALPYQDLTIMDACLEAGVHYLDTANYEPPDTAKFEYKWQWAYQERFKKAGLTALLGSGFDPGATNMFTAYLAKHYFDEIHELDIIDVNGGDHGYPFATNFNPEINIREVSAECRHWENGEFVTTPAMSKDSTVYLSARASAPTTSTACTTRSWSRLSKHFPSLKRAQFWMSFSDNYLKHLEVLENVGMTGIDQWSSRARRSCPSSSWPACCPIPPAWARAPRARPASAVSSAASRTARSGSCILYNICDHQACYAEVQSQAISYTTGVPAMIGAKMILEGKWHAARRLEHGTV